jgi:hypothetical protein
MIVEYLYLVGIFVAGCAAGLLIQWTVHRRLLRLEFRQADLEQQLLRQRGRQAVEERWKKRPPEQEILDFLQKQEAPPERKRFANDPLVE